MPEDFDHISYDSVKLRLSHHSQTNTSGWELFVAGWNGIAHRFRAMSEYDNEFTLAKLSVNVSFDTRYLEEKSLFGFFVSGSSVLDCLSFGLHATGIMLDSLHFSSNFKTLSKVNLDSVTVSYQSTFSQERLTDILASVKTSPEYIEWKKVRNVLVHRAVPSRKIHFESSSSGYRFPAKPPMWKTQVISEVESFDISESTTSRRRIWLSEQVNLLLREIDIFTKNQFGD